MTLGLPALLAFLVGIIVGWCLRGMPVEQSEAPTMMPHFLVCGDCGSVVPVTVGGTCGVCGSEALARSGRAAWTRRRVLRPIPQRGIRR